MTETPGTPAGYYDDGSGRQRLWDGTKWTDQYQDAPAGAAPVAGTHAAAGPVATANPKADAKAAKAYNKANRQWYQKKRWWVIGAVAAIIIIVAATSGGGGGSKDNNGEKASTSTSDTKKDSSNSGKTTDSKPGAYGSTKLPLQNGDWRLDSFSVKNDGLGDFGGTARITYTGDDKDGGNNIFTITAFSGKKLVATFQGSANTVKPGTSVTVQFISQDKFVNGKFAYDFQNDL